MGCDALVGRLATNEDIYPKLNAELIAGDFDEGHAWVRQHSRKFEAPSDSFGAEWCYELTFHRRGVKHYAASHTLRKELTSRLGGPAI